MIQGPIVAYFPNCAPNVPVFHQQPLHLQHFVGSAVAVVAEDSIELKYYSVESHYDSCTRIRSASFISRASARVKAGLGPRSKLSSKRVFSELGIPRTS